MIIVKGHGTLKVGSRELKVENVAMHGEYEYAISDTTAWVINSGAGTRSYAAFMEYGHDAVTAVSVIDSTATVIDETSLGLPSPSEGGSDAA